jgi:hypothetical protein
VDGILETFVYFEDREKHSQETLQEMEEAICSSAQKKTTEEVYHPKTLTTISFNLDEQPPSCSRSRQQQMQAWRDGLNDPPPKTPAARPPPTPAPTRGVADEDVFLPRPATAEDQEQISLTLERLASVMERKLDMMQAHQERFAKGLIQEM